MTRAPTGDVQFFVAYDITPDATDHALLQWLSADEIPATRTPAPKSLLEQIWTNLHAAAIPDSSLAERVVLSMSWYRRALRETDVLFRFSNLWLALEALNPRLCDYYDVPRDERQGLPGLRRLLDDVVGAGAFTRAVKARNDLLHVARVRPDTIRERVQPIADGLDDALVEAWRRLLGVDEDAEAPSSSVWPYPSRYILRASVRPDEEGWSENRHPWFEQSITLTVREPDRPGCVTFDQTPKWTVHNVGQAQVLSIEFRGPTTPNPPRTSGPTEIRVIRADPT